MVEAGEIETEDLGWKVLSINNDGTVNLIANNNTGFEVSLSGINGYTNGVKALNEICSKLLLSWTSPRFYRSINSINLIIK